jgi:iron complex outermembrane receptor protein
MAATNKRGIIMEMFRKELLVGGSRAALTAAACFFAMPAMAQQAPAAPPLEEVTVTGTSIRGAAPVGSNVITVDQEAIRVSGAKNMEELLNTIPALSTANAAPQGVNNNSFFAPQIHQLAGSISNSTLAVVDGMRFVGAGGDTLADPNIIPTAAIQRVEVLADGASAIYGSDAVSGVVNFITRKDYEGLEIGLEAGLADQYNATNGTLLWGTKWDKGSVLFAAGYLFQSELRGNTRRLPSMGDYTTITPAYLGARRRRSSYRAMPGSSCRPRPAERCQTFRPTRTATYSLTATRCRNRCGRMP